MKFNLQAFDIWPGIKISLGLIIMMALERITGGSWITTALVALFVWLTNTPGPLKYRVLGMLVFSLGAATMTFLHGQTTATLWPTILIVMVIGFLGTIALIWGMRAFMVGYSLICWAIYSPLLVVSTSMANVLLAILAGSAILTLLNLVGEILQKDRKQEKEYGNQAPQGNIPEMSYILAYGATVALTLGLTNYYGWVELETDPTLMAGGAFFILGFDIKKTWLNGFSRALGMIGGATLGFLLAHVLEDSFISYLIMIGACGLSFSAMGVHPGAWMFFFMIFVGMGWQELDAETLALSVHERFYGELWGIAVAMIAILFLQWWYVQHRKRKDNPGRTV